jgi:hypothetical protein
MSLGESVGAETSGDAALTRPAIGALIDAFADAKTFGSLIQVPAALAAALPELEAELFRALESGDVFARSAAEELLPLVTQARTLAMRFDAVVANPPYMASKGMNALARKFAQEHFPGAKTDLFACFLERGYTLTERAGFLGLMTPFTWMFLNSYEVLRNRLFESRTLQSLIQPEYHAFFDSAYVPICTFVVQNAYSAGYAGTFIRLGDFYGAELQSTKALEAIKNPDCDWLFRSEPDEFKKIPGSPVAYWASDKTRKCFQVGVPLASLVTIREGINTGDNERFLRFWSEVGTDRIEFMTRKGDSFGAVWSPHNKGGEFRRWYGNRYFVMNWRGDGADIHRFHDLPLTYNGAPVRGKAHFFQASISWSRVSSGRFAVRFYERGFSYDSTAPSIFCDEYHQSLIAGFLNSNVVDQLLATMSPTLDYRITSLGRLPAMSDCTSQDRARVGDCVVIAKSDWDAYERSWEFQSLPILAATTKSPSSLEFSHIAWVTQNRDTITKMKRLEEENNRFFIDAYGLADELTPEVPIEQITLTVNPTYRYGKKLADDEWSVEHGFGEDLEARFREDTMQELVSYAIGCMMGRYRLDRPGLIYAHSGNKDFEAIYNAVREESTDDTDEHRSRNEHLCPSVSSVDKNPFPADTDGIIPITESNWFDDDALNRIREFLLAVWPEEVDSGKWIVNSEDNRLSTIHYPLSTNMQWLAESLGAKSGETPDETIRRYLSTTFFKDHLQTYKRRPIYWCFSSGKQKAFEALVYLHRYHEGTLARMRMEYVVPLQGKMAARIDRLVDDIASASTTAQAKRLQKERDKLTRQLDELRRYDEQLRHYADQRIALDLDDGVKVNYAKFGDLLAEVKAVTGTTAE